MLFRKEPLWGSEWLLDSSADRTTLTVSLSQSELNRIYKLRRAFSAAVIVPSSR